jgi:hypothetical protein
MADLAETIDPRRAMIRRQMEAGLQPAAVAPSPAASTAQASPRFGRQFTDAERAQQMQKLAEILRARQAVPQ